MTRDRARLLRGPRGPLPSVMPSSPPTRPVNPPPIGDPFPATQFWSTDTTAPHTWSGQKAVGHRLESSAAEFDLWSFRLGLHNGTGADMDMVFDIAVLDQSLTVLAERLGVTVTVPGTAAEGYTEATAPWFQLQSEGPVVCPPGGADWRILAVRSLTSFTAMAYHSTVKNPAGANGWHKTSAVTTAHDVFVNSSYPASWSGMFGWPGSVISKAALIWGYGGA